jgi:putative hydrolase of HD superfamily
MIGKGIIERFYEAASIQRWNDHVRPVELTELDKQAHKMLIAFVLAKYEAMERNVNINWISLIEGGFFEFLHRLILTDIKPPVFHQMMERKGKELNEWVLEQLTPDISMIKGDFAHRFRQYLLGDPELNKLEKKILKAAHYLATNWEFKIIYNMNPFIYGIERTKEEIENEIEDYFDLIGVQKISLGKKSFGFIDLCGQLRFQQRWAQSPRLPKTSVLGHMLIVAMLAYLCSIEINACDRRIYNNYFSALFHDLPEVLTRDIVSPVKRSIKGLQDLIKEYEGIQVEERILPLLPTSWHKEIRFFVEDEFDNKIIKNGTIIKGLSNEEITAEYNQDEFSPLDGKIIKACDHLAAFIEASLSIKYGVKAPHLVEGKKRLQEMYRGVLISGINFGEIFDYFMT